MLCFAFEPVQAYTRRLLMLFHIVCSKRFPVDTTIAGNNWRRTGGPHVRS